MTQLHWSRINGDLETGPGANGGSVDIAVPDLPKSTYRVSATFIDIKGNVVTSSKDVQVADTVGPAGAVAINGGAAYAGSTGVTVGVTATDVSGVTKVALSNNGSTFTTYDYAPEITWTLTSGDGTKKVWAKWLDGLGHWSAAKTDTIVLDRVNPTNTAPKRTLRSGIPFAASAIVVRLYWSGSDSTSGIATYDLARSVDGGSWSTVATGLTSARSDQQLASGHTYRFRVRARDKAGRLGVVGDSELVHAVAPRGDQRRVDVVRDVEGPGRVVVFERRGEACDRSGSQGPHHGHGAHGRRGEPRRADQGPRNDLRGRDPRRQDRSLRRNRCRSACRMVEDMVVDGEAHHHRPGFGHERPAERRSRRLRQRILTDRTRLVA